MGQEFRDVEADAAGTDDGDLLAGLLAAFEQVDVARDLGVVYAGNRRRARHDAGGDDDVVVTRKVGGGDTAIELDVDLQFLQTRTEVAQGFAEFLLARDAAREVELAADFRGGIEQADLVPALGQLRCGGKPGRAGADHGDLLRCAVAASTVTSSSWQAKGLTRQEQSWREKMWSRQAWLQAMQVLIASARPAAALFTNSASARKGRAIETMSASPRAMTSSATCGSLMRLVVISGILTSPFMRAVTQV
jgi:hypothetical protein